MAPLIKTVALCLVALGTQTARATDGTVGDVPDDLYTILNLARKGHLPVSINKVAKEATVVTAVKDALGEAVTTDCAGVATMTPTSAEGFMLTFPVTAGDPNPDYKDLVQKALTTGLSELGNEYPKTKWGAAPWTKPAVTNLGYLLWQNSSQVGCALTKCPVGGDKKNVVLCRFTPTAANDQVPFSEEFFKALKDRTVQISQMKPEDADGPAPSSGYMIVPSFVLMGLVALLSKATV